MRLIDTKPTLTGTKARAWSLDADQTLPTTPNPPPDELTVAQWIIHAPHSPTPSHSFGVFCCSLRDVPGLPPSAHDRPGVTHAVMLYALDPLHDVAAFRKHRRLYVPRIHVLEPPRFVGHITSTDQEAAQRVRDAVGQILAGTLPLYMLYHIRKQWEELFGSPTPARRIKLEELNAPGPHALQ